MLLPSQATTDFIAAHRTADVRQLALTTPRGGEINIPYALEQIAGWQVARAKLPEWASIDGIVYPPHLSMEQCSSQNTARRKRALVVGDSLTDLTGGMGVDFSYMAIGLKQATYVEQQQSLCDIALHNFSLLGLSKVLVACDTAEHYLATMPPCDTIYIDPARRDHNGNRVYGIADCSPNVTMLAPTMLSKAQRVIIKLSPMLDVTQAIRALPSVSRVHIVCVAGECKELLLVLDRGHQGDAVVHCINDENDFSFTLGEIAPPPPIWDNESINYLYEPHAAIMKAGCFAHVAQRFDNLIKVAHDSHLFVSIQRVNDFPGRIFRIDAVTTLNKAELRRHLRNLTHANIATRNFPLKPQALASRLKLKDGGNAYIFATTTAHGNHVLFITHKDA